MGSAAAVPARGAATSRAAFAGLSPQLHSRNRPFASQRSSDQSGELSGWLSGP